MDGAGSWVDCHTCKGKGYVTLRRLSDKKLVELPCEKCYGRGKVISLENQPQYDNLVYDPTNTKKPRRFFKRKKLNKK